MDCFSARYPCMQLQKCIQCAAGTLLSRRDLVWYSFEIITKRNTMATRYKTHQTSGGRR